MDASFVRQLMNLPLPYLIIFLFFVFCVVVSALIAIYVGLRALLDSRNKKKARRFRRYAWLAERERMYGRRK
jgi:hypothetical protein